MLTRWRSTPASLCVSLEDPLPLDGRVSQPLAEARVARVDEDLLAGLGILHIDRAHVGQLGLAGIAHLESHDLMAAGEQGERTLPSLRADEVGHDDDEDRRRPALPSRGTARRGR